MKSGAAFPMLGEFIHLQVPLMPARQACPPSPAEHHALPQSHLVQATQVKAVSGSEHKYTMLQNAYQLAACRKQADQLVLDLKAVCQVLSWRAWCGSGTAVAPLSVWAPGITAAVSLMRCGATLPRCTLEC
jgi:hypothetical protein